MAEQTGKETLETKKSTESEERARLARIASLTLSNNSLLIDRLLAMVDVDTSASPRSA
jgi:hypothetical protein